MTACSRVSLYLSFAIAIPLAIVALSIVTMAAGYPVKVAGQQHTLVLMSDGSVVGWGAFDWGELGPIAAIQGPRNYSTGAVAIRLPRKAIDIAAGESSSYALLDDGTVVSWGSNLNMMLGVGAAGDKLILSNGKKGSEVPVRVSGLSDIVRIGAGGRIAIALKRDGTVYCWGLEMNERLGDGNIPTQIPGVRGISQISVSSTHAMFLDTNGRVRTWGGNLYGQLGRSTEVDKAGIVPGLSNVISIAAGLGVSTVIRADGTVWVWGSNWNAQFGNGQRTAAPVYGGLSNVIEVVPQQVPGVRNAVSVTSGLAGRHTLVLLKDGTLRGWGNTDWGQLGAGVSGTFQENPVIPKIAGVKAVFAVQNNSYAIKTDNSLWIWGIGGRFPLEKQAKIPVPLVLNIP